MSRYLIHLVFLLACALVPSSVLAITIDTVPVGDAGNVNDPGTFNRYGGVSYAYSIGKYEVTVGQYTAFLNAVAASDPYSLYNPTMATEQDIAGIGRTGSSGNYVYNVIGSANHPIAYVSWGDAARFANWLQNGQPNGAEGNGTTEIGAYTLNGATSASNGLASVTRNAGATWFIPTENEWYKAAYYQPSAQGGDADSYWSYPTKSNSAPYSDQPPGATPDNSRVANYYNDDGAANGYNDGFAVTGSTNQSNTQNYLTDVGAYATSPSYYGTFDQGGNLSEWNETVADPQTFSRGIGGGSWVDSSVFMAALSGHGIYQPQYEYGSIGFRVGNIPALMGDFNGDGKVDAADYVTFRKSNGSEADYAKWRANFGASSGLGAASAIGVPEPPVWVLVPLVVVCVGLFFFPRLPVEHASTAADCMPFAGCEREMSG